MEQNDVELRFSGLSAPDGEIALADLVAIAAPLQELATRIGRFAVDQRGPGRSYAAVESATQLRLIGVSDGSTRLSLGFGQADVLDFDNGLERKSADLLWEVVAGVASGAPPEWTTDGIDETAVKLLDALGRARHVEVTRGDGRRLDFQPSTARRDVWVHRDTPTDVVVTMVGHLRALDIDRASFRLTDDVGNRIALFHVEHPEQAATLVGRRVAAVGKRLVSASGEFRGIEAPELSPVVLPAEWSVDASTDLADQIATLPGPDPDGGVDMTDEEFDAFLAAMRS